MSSDSSSHARNEARGVGLPAEAARYALLRRLAPSMRHHLVVNLQPIGMIHEVLDRRLRAPEPNLHDITESAHKINGFAKAALASCIDVVTWLAPQDGAACALHEVVRECLGLMATSFTFRGYALRDEVPALGGDVNRAAARTVLSAALLSLSDQHPAPADIVLRAAAAAEGIELDLAVQAAAGEAGIATVPTYRPITADDLRALARADDVGLEMQPARIRLLFRTSASAAT